MTLALLLTAVTGAWAQSSPNVVEFKVPANWETDESPVTAGDLTGFKASTLDEVNALGAPAEGYALLFYAFDGDNASYIFFAEGKPISNTTTPYKKNLVFNNSKSMKFYYTVEPTEWSLTPDETGKTWTLAKMPASDIELQVEYEPTKVTMAVNDKTMGTAEVAGESKVEWTADTWNGWTFNTKEYTVDDITMTSSQDAYINEITEAGDYLHSLSFFVNQWEDNSTVTFSTTGDPFSRIEFTMIENYGEYNPNIKPNDNWTIEGKSAVWEGEATKSLTLQSCSTEVSKITFFKGVTPDGVTINGDGTFTVAKTATVTLKATPAEGYKFLYWEDDQTNTNPVREVTIESGMADMTYKAVFAANEYNITFVEGTNPDPENPEWTATPNPAKTKQTVTVTYTGQRKVMGVKAEKKAPAVTVTWNYDDITGTGKSFTKDGVTITAGNIDFSQKNFMQDGTFTTTLGNFTKIEVSGGNCTASGEGWSGDNTKKTWTGNASSVSFSGKIHGNGEGTLKFVFTIEPTN
ncbi:hypothetical protein L6470_00175 [Prevotella communis]|uniref:InlB B-repeat-containing protein n=1 Tax=Prevotella communis TaxID=2913614 RepID=UPI001EDB5492|nr:hypothetical protein [Prevotella communis]UKK59463.1 hypothetical protein L6470_00175 [Prevotella communis]